MMKWRKVEDGEYNEQNAHINGHLVTISSDESGTSWDCIIDGKETYSLTAQTEYEAQLEATDDAMHWD